MDNTLEKIEEARAIVQKLTDKYIAEVDAMCDAKEKDILEV